ncbi:MAG: lamin tail domain-containing protein [Bacteroidota bacterium]
MILRYNSILFLILWSVSGAFGQVSDNFSDNDFTNNPTWTGNNDGFIVDSEVLRLDTMDTGEAHLATTNAFLNNTTWQFDVTLDFNPSGSNRAFIYLVSDQEDLQGSLNGYYVLIGNSSDEISLYRQDGTSSTKIIDGADDLVDIDPVNVNVRVTRSTTGEWSLYQNVDNGGETLAGTVTDLTYTTTTYFGFLADYTSTRSTSFFFDNVLITKPLEIDKVFASSENEVIVRYNQDVTEVSATNTSNYELDNDITISGITKDGGSNSDFVITTNEPLTDNSFNLSVNNIEDALTATPITTGIDKTFDYLNLIIENVVTISETTVRLDFNQAVDKTIAENTANYNINQSIGQPLSATRDAVNTDLVELTIATELQESLLYNVTVSNLRNEIGNSTFNGVSPNFEFIIPILIDTAFATSSTTISVVFNKNLDPTTATDVSNYDLTDLGNPQSVALLNDSTASLTFATSLQNGTATITVNGVQNSDNSLTANGLSTQFEYLSIELSSTSVTGDSEITLVFNQEIDSTSARNTSNYEVNFSIGNPTEITYSKDIPNQVILTFDNLVNNDYQLTVSNISNRLLNSTLSATSSDFEISKPTNPGDILINEIFADPTPMIGLPASEFTEIFNNTSSHINLEDFQFSGGTLPDVTLAPGAYLILTGTGNVDDYTSFGDVAGVTSFPGLTNSGRDLVLKDNFGNQIDSLRYDVSWYGDEEKADGGFSLELINPNLPCSGSFNWIASNDPSGGTPGTQNSVFDISPDLTAPQVSLITVIASDSLLISFNETIELGGITTNNFSLAGNTIEAVSTIDESFGQVAIKLGTSLVSETFYTLNYQDIEDCSGNSEANSFEFYYDIQPPEVSSVIISSFDDIILIFSEPLNEEIAETEANYVADNDLGEASFTQLVDEFPNRVFIDFSSDLQVGTIYTLSVSNIADTLGNAITNASIQFQYEQSVDSVAVIAPNIIDVYFNQSLAKSSAESIDNYNLEELDNPVNAALDEQNTALVHLAFDDNIRENSERSLFISNILNSSDELISTPEFLFTYDTRAPSLDSVAAVDSTQLLVVFTEIVNEASAEIVSHYELNEDIFPDSVRIQEDQSNVIAYFREPFEKEVEQEITVRNVEDPFGNSSSSATNRRLNFTYDPLPPRLDSVIQLALDSIMLDFSEPLENLSALSVGNYQLGGTNPQSVLFKNGDSSRLTLVLSAPLQESNDQTITISNISDRNGNQITEPITRSFNTLNPEVNLLQFITPDTLLIGFSKPMALEPLTNPENYTVSALPAIGSVTAITENQVSVNFSEKLNDQQTGEILLSDQIVATNGNPLSISSFEILFDDLFNTTDIINDNTIALIFDVEVNSPSMENFTIVGDMSQPLIVSKDIDEPEVIRLIFGEPVTPDTKLTISWQGLLDIFDNQIPNSETQFKVDTNSPKVAEITTGLFNELTIRFSEKVEEVSATAFNHYRLVGNELNPVNAIEFEEDSIVAITFEQNLVDQQSYNLSIERVEDLSGNILADTAITFQFVAPEIPQSGDILITEIMADPTPSVGLPDAEYIEIFNASDKAFDLSTIVFSDASSVISLPNFELAAQTYLTITNTTAATEFNENVLGISGFPSLGNTGDSLSIVNVNDQLVDQVVYESSWYNDSEKDDGGYSLERISLLEACNIVANWTASDATNGGTPGEVNSVFDNSPDETNPAISTFTFDGNDLVINFNEPMDTATFLVSAISSQPEVSITSVTPTQDRLTINISGAFQTGVIYEITLTGLSDCSGNALVDNLFSVGKGEVPEPGDLIITEIMADPEPSQGQPIAEYLELHNKSNKLLTIDGLILADRSGETTVGPATIEAGNYLVLTTTNSVDLFPSNISVLGVSSFPSLGNSGDSLSIRNSNDVTLDVVDYSSDWYNDTEKDDGGFSLERISLLEACNIEANWTASNASDGGTPGAVNSVFDNTPDTEAPEIVTFNLTEENLIIFFNEPMDTAALRLGTYSFNPSVAVGEIAPGTDRQSVVIDAVFSEGIIYELTIENVSDCSGNPLLNNQLSFGQGKTPAFGELIITEIMADPEPSQGLPITEYLEIFNASDELINLGEVVLSDATGNTPLPAGIILPGEYLTLTPTSSVDLFADNVKVIGVSGWLSLNNGGEKLALNVGANEIFSVIYSDDWYNDPLFDGGRSLEMVDVSNFCGEENNWTAASEDVGGTPGAVNSVTAANPDLRGPELLNAFAINSQSIELIFDEKLILDGGEIQVSTSPELTLENFTIINERGSKARISSVTNIEPRVEYSISLSGFSDCSGNTSQANEVTFVLAEPGLSGDLLLSEILFNPRSGGVDFVEIHNNSEKFINLNGWAIGNDDFTESGISRLITEENLIIPPSGYLAFTEDKGITTSDYPNNSSEFIIEIDDLPTFPDSEGTVVLVDPDGNLIEQFDYVDDLQSSLLDDDDGVSLERISFTSESNNPENWKSAASGAGFATPGEQNSQILLSIIPESIVSISPKVFVPDGTGGNSNQAFTTINYELDNVGSFANVSIYNANGQFIKEIANGELLSAKGFFRWDGLNENGNIVKVGYYIVLFELYDNNGNTNVIKETVVVGTQF